jgi:hypothetical protein
MTKQDLIELIEAAASELDEIESVLSDASDIESEIADAIRTLESITIPDTSSCDVDEIRSKLDELKDLLEETPDAPHSVRVWANTAEGRSIVYEGDLNSSVAIEFI